VNDAGVVGVPEGTSGAEGQADLAPLPRTDGGWLLFQGGSHFGSNPNPYKICTKLQRATEDPMKFLVTSSRLPFALDEIRKLGEQGHEVVAADTFRTAPGNHSRYTTSWHVVASPRYQTLEFLTDLRAIARAERVDLVLPSFEEALYLARDAGDLGPGVPVFAPSFETLHRLHSKARLLDLAGRLGIPTPATVLADSRTELAAATRRFEHFFARPAFSRGGLDLLTNTGPLANALRLEQCQPTAQNPWIVQEYVEGEDVCSFSIAHRGRVTGHSTYIHPRVIESAGGITFESIEDPATLATAQAIATETGYHGQLSFDFRRTDRGLLLIECNPRPTAGVLVMSSEMFVDALLDRRPDQVLVAPAGVQFKMSSALLRDMFLHWQEARADIAALVSKARDVYATPGDWLPALYQVLSYTHVLGYRLRGVGPSRPRTALVAGYLHDISWNPDEP
jgi:hypothetical protein